MLLRDVGRSFKKSENRETDQPKEEDFINFNELSSFTNTQIIPADILSRDTINLKDIISLDSTMSIGSRAYSMLSSLLRPTTREQFYSDYWQKLPLFYERKDTSNLGCERVKI